MDEVRRQLAELLARVERLEERLAQEPATAPRETAPPATSEAEPPGPVRPTAPTPPPPARSDGTPESRIQQLDGRIAKATTGKLPMPTATTVMATGAAAAFVLAAVYFIKLVYDTGWLTPERQLFLAVTAGAALIAAGLRLARYDRAYAAFLPAAGVVILYMTFYAGHLWYGMLDPRFVLGAVGVITFVAIGLHQHFRNGLYALLAVAGAYSFPVLLPSRSPELLEVVLYFAAWGLLFSWMSIQQGNRSVYLLALWLAVTGFDIAWRSSASDMWQLAAGWHFVQFLLFAVTAAAYSIRHRSAMTTAETLLHGGALFYFYGIEYLLIVGHSETAAHWIALASVAVVVGLHAAARRLLPGDRGPDGSAVLVSAYAAVVTAHVLVFEMMPAGYWPWGFLLLALVPQGLGELVGKNDRIVMPLRIVFGSLFAIGLGVLLGADPWRTEIPAPLFALLLYTGLLWFGAWRQYRSLGRHYRPPILLYTGHLAFMVLAAKASGSDLTTSLYWGAFAVGLLVVALANDDRVLGASSLLVFAAFALKVVLIDLTGSPSLLRVITLIVLGGSLYVGGWLYQRMPGPDAPEDASPSAADGSSRSSG